MTELKPYRLSILGDAVRWRPEIEHVFGFLDDCYCFERGDKGSHIEVGNGSEPVDADSLSAHGFDALFEASNDGVRLKSSIEEKIGRGAVPSALDPEAEGFDILASLFFWISRVEERNVRVRDRYDRFPSSAAFQRDCLAKGMAPADQALEKLALTIAGQHPVERRSRFKAILTHDVDRLKAWHHPVNPVRQIAGEVLKRHNPRKAWHIAEEVICFDPFASFRQIMDWSEQRDLTSRFYFMGPSSLSQDSPYVMRYPELTRRVADEVRTRGHIVGFHPGFASFNDANEWGRQKTGLEQVLDHNVTEGRQHVLRYSAEITPVVQSENGFCHDYSLAYPEFPGFRSGTCRSHLAYDLVGRKTLPLRQTSTAIMDFGFFGGKYLDVSVDEAIEMIGPVVDTVRQYDGELVVLYHTGLGNDPETDLYYRIIDELL